MGKSEGRFSGMVFSGFALDPAKSNQLTLGEKRKLVHEVIEFSEDAPRILSSLTRRELLEIICAEMGKERKYTGFTKIRMIEHLLKVVSKKHKKKNADKSLAFSPAKNEAGFKRQRKQEQLIQLPSQLGHVSCETIEEAENLLCENLACRATMRGDDVFCKRCSCCICYQYDDNKDPSLWLTCDSEFPGEGESCGMSCHLKCAVTHKQAGILKNGSRGKLDGGFYCVSCGKVNGLMRTWRKQLLVAKEARRVDILCLRVSLSHKILQGTEQYKELLKIVEFATKMLENEVGPLDWASKKMDRGIVNRLSCGTEVQKLCASAVEAFDFMSSNTWPYRMDHKEPPMCRICFEKLSPTSVTVVLEYGDHLFKELLGCKLWHRKSTSKDYPPEATYIVLRPEKRFDLTNLDPSTEYSCKVSFFSNTRMLGIWEAKWITPGSSGSSVSVSDEPRGERERTLKLEPQVGLVAYYDKKLRTLDDIKADGSHIQGPTSYPPSTPGKCDGITKISSFGGKKEPKESDYEYSVRVVRRLEHEGHLDRDFRVKFLTWFSLKATTQERRVVSVFVDALIDDPKSLAAQLIDTFADEICGERKRVSQHGFCARLWH